MPVPWSPVVLLGSKHTVIGKASVLRTCLLVKWNQPKTSRDHPWSDTHAGSDAGALCSQRRHVRGWWPRGGGASWRRCAVLLAGPERSAGTAISSGLGSSSEGASGSGRDDVLSVTGEGSLATGCPQY